MYELFNNNFTMLCKLKNENQLKLLRVSQNFNERMQQIFVAFQNLFPLQSSNFLQQENTIKVFKLLWKYMM